METHEDRKELDAGLRPLDHYEQVYDLFASPVALAETPFLQRLGYKFPLRQSILPLVRCETPYLAQLQVSNQYDLPPSYSVSR
jgi:hypothetical protein